MLLLVPIEAANWKKLISQEYGENPDWYPNTNGHNGIDFDVDEGTPIRAAEGGQVLRSELDPETAGNPKKGYGYNIMIEHPDGTRSVYGHFMKGGLLVITGQRVSMGEQIGMSGNTGNSTDDHLHFEIRRTPSYKSCIDPLPFLVDKIPSKKTLWIAKITILDGVSVRRGPGTEHDQLAPLKVNTRVQVFGLAGTDVWLEVEGGFMKYDPSWYDLTESLSFADALLEATVTASSGVKLRNGPSTDHDRITTLLKGSKVQGKGLAGTDVWLRIQTGYTRFNPDWYTFEPSEPH